MRTARSIICTYNWIADNTLCNNQINARALIGQSAMGYCTGKPTEKSWDVSKTLEEFVNNEPF